MGSDREDTDDGAAGEIRALRQRVAELEGALSESRRAQDALRLGEERFRTIASAMAQVIWTSRADQQGVTDLLSLKAFSGHDERAFAGQGWAETIHPDDRQRIVAALQGARGSGLEHVGEYRFRRHDGVYRDCILYFVPLRGADGQVREWIGACVDITDRKGAEDALRASEERFRAIATHLPVGVFQTDANGDCVYVNELWMELAGLRFEQALGSGWVAALHPEDRDRVGKEWYEAATTGRAFQSELRFMTPQGKVTWLSSTAASLRDEAGAITGYFGTVTDMTERRRAEEVYREGLVQQEIIRAQEATLAELSTPLIPINDRVVAMPLIGAVDERRAARVLEALLAGVAARGARVTILDITGVPTVDARVADALVRAGRAVQLLGAQMVLSGIRPDVAQTLVELGADLGGIVTVGSLQAAIAHAMRVAR